MVRKIRMACHANPSSRHSQIHSLMFWPSLRFFRWRFSKKPSDFLLTAVVLFCQRNEGRVGCLLRPTCPTGGGSADTGMTGGWRGVSLGGVGVVLVGFIHAGRHGAEESRRTGECCRRQLIRQPVVLGAWVGGALFLGEGVHDSGVHVGKAVADGWKEPSTRQCGEDETFF